MVSIGCGISFGVFANKENTVRPLTEHFFALWMVALKLNSIINVWVTRRGRNVLILNHCLYLCLFKGIKPFSTYSVRLQGSMACVKN